VIDAIRWVMGESSARQLRGDAMSDVIFAGTTQRKPVGQASVELIFENTLGKLGGAYNSYTELSVRRQVTREGRSDYFLNGTRCRRRDITDIFLGTGLGPRSYAVIQQGMINRLVEARPDELRVFLEEAAGVSRYQARRRETMDHLAQTRLNVARLQDVAQELDSQIKSLKRQSQAAERYKSLQAEQRQLQLELWSIDLDQLTVQQGNSTEQLAVMGEHFRELRRHRSHTEAEWQQTSHTLSTLLADAEPEQQRLQQCEQAYAHADHTQQQCQQQHALSAIRLADLQAQYVRITQQQHDDQHNQAGLHAEIAALKTQLAEWPQTDTLQQQVQHSDQAWYAQQQQVQQTEQQQQQIAQTLARQHHEIGLIERQRLRQEQQLSQLHSSLAQLGPQAWRAEYPAAEQAREQSQLARLHLQQQLDQQLATHQVLSCQQVDTEQAWQALTQQRTDWQAEKQALLSLQHSTQPNPAQAVCADTHLIRLTDQLVLSATGQAHLSLIERVLGAWLSAVIAADPCTGSHHLSASSAERLNPPLHDPAVQPLSDWIVAPQYSLWQGIGVVSDPTHALTLRADLHAGQSLLTLDAQWFGPDWHIDLTQTPTDASAGVLARQWRLDAIQAVWQDSQAAYEQLDQTRHRQQAALQALDLQLSTGRTQLAQHEREYHQYDLQCTRLAHAQALRQQQHDQYQQQCQHLQDALNDDNAQLDDLYLERTQSQQRLAPLQQQLAQQQQHLTEIRQQRDDTREQSRRQLEQRQHTHAALQVAESKQSLMAQTLTRAHQQALELQDSLNQTQQHHTQLTHDLPRCATQYQADQIAVLSARQQWAERQSRLEAVQTAQQHLSDARQKGQIDEDHLRDQMEQTRLAWQQLNAAIAHVQQQLAALPAEPQQGCVADQGQRVARGQEIERQLARLGELNLAAPAALRELSTRHDELTHQMDDLNQTIVQLETAMHSIDQETRSLFMNTFDRVNDELQVLFPKVFGGGQARLSLDEGWQSGVRLMAQPPGKKNSSIALLSGGEKTLTALALVFAIFRLNPAPFCLLDEVDAPLDDANVQRFCGLVSELSQQVQFIYISHNKLAMSMADHLLGVTMPEAGVSRLVSVNLEQAAAFGITQE
jgi:chromosome segregation protein